MVAAQSPDTMRREGSFTCALFSETHNLHLKMENIRKTQNEEDCSTEFLSRPDLSVKVRKDKERLSKCCRLEEMSRHDK